MNLNEPSSNFMNQCQVKEITTSSHSAQIEGFIRKQIKNSNDVKSEYQMKITDNFKASKKLQVCTIKYSRDPIKGPVLSKVLF